MRASERQTWRWEAAWLRSMRIKNSQKDNCGATLVEVVMATAILGVVAAGIMGCFSLSFLSLQLARENQRATQILLEKVETIRLYSWDQVNSPGFVPATFTDYYNPNARSGAQGTAYSGTMTVGSVPFSTSYSTNLRQLTVTLEWATRDKLRHTRTLSTLIARDGLQNYVY